MSGTTNLNAPLITASQNQKEVTANAAFARFDAALTATLAVSVSGGNAAPTAEEYRAAARVLVSGATTDGRTLTLPILKRPMLIKLAAASTKAITIVRGTQSRTLLPGGALEVYTDGTSNGLDVMGEHGPYRAPLWIRGAPSNSEILTRWQVKGDPLVLLPNMLGWSVVADTPATAITVWSVRKNGSAVGTLTWAAAGTVPVLATTSGAAQTFAVDDFFDLIAATTADVSLADVSGTILMMRG